MVGLHPLIRGFPHTANISTNKSVYYILGKSLEAHGKLREPAGALTPFRLFFYGRQISFFFTLVIISSSRPPALYPDLLFLRSLSQLSARLQYTYI